MKKDLYQSLEIFHFSNLIRKDLKVVRLRCVVFGNFGTMNVGDEALLAGELEELRRLEGLEVTVVSRFPREVKRLHRVRAVSFYSFAEVFREVLRADFVVVGGGGVVCKIDRGLVAFFYQVYMLAMYLFLPIVLRKNVYALGLGFYDNAHPVIKSMALNFLKKCQIVTVRDFHSFDVLKDRNMQVFLYRDNSFLMKVMSVSRILEESNMRRRYDKQRVNIGLSFVKPSNKVDEEKFISEFSDFVRKHYATADFWFYSLDFYPNYFNDYVFGKQVYYHLKGLFGDDLRFHFVPRGWGPEKVFGSFKLMNFFVGMRLHASIFCYRLKIPFVGVSYDLKCGRFLESIGREVVQVGGVTAKNLDEEFSGIRKV